MDADADLRCTVPANHSRSSSQVSGDESEHYVARFLQEKGLTLLACQYSVPRMGELDLVMRRGDVLYIVEVKSRHRLDSFGGGLSAITAHKKGNLIKTALHYAQKHHYMNLNMRFLAAEVKLVDGHPAGAIHLVPIDLGL